MLAFVAYGQDGMPQKYEQNNVVSKYAGNCK